MRDVEVQFNQIMFPSLRYYTLKL